MLDRPADLPVAAPDPAEIVREARMLLASKNECSPTLHRVGNAALAVLLAERQQDKERIAQYEADWEWLAENGTHEYGGEPPHDGCAPCFAWQVLNRDAAALAVEEDADELFNRADAYLAESESRRAADEEDAGMSAGYLVRCTECGREQMSGASPLTRGWPKCCGYTMRLEDNERFKRDIDKSIAAIFAPVSRARGVA